MGLIFEQKAVITTTTGTHHLLACSIVQNQTVLVIEYDHATGIK